MNDTEEFIVEALCESLKCDEFENYTGPGDSYYFDTGGGNGSLSVTNQRLDQLKRELNGLTLNITYMDDYPLSYTVTENGTMSARGVAFELLEFLTEKLNFSYTLVKPEKNIMGSSDQYNGSILELLDTERADVAASFLPVMTDPRKHIFYSVATLDEGEWQMIMTRPAESATGSGLLAPFDFYVWILILISLLVVGPIIYLLIIIRMKLTKDREKVYSLPHCVWFVYGALMRQGSVLSPIGDSTRILFATWWIFITILTSFYTANLTAFLTLSKFMLPINTVEDILRKEKSFVAHQGGAVEYAIKNTNETLMALSRMVDKNLAVFVDTLNDTDVLLTYVEKQNYVFVRDKPAISHMIYRDYKYRKTIKFNDEKVHCAFATAKTAFLKRRRTFAYSEKFRFQALFDHELLHMVEAGIVKYKLLENLPNAEICPNNLGGTERQLRNGDLMMTYYVMIAGFCTSIAVFVSEMFFKLLNYHQSKKVEPLSRNYGRNISDPNDQKQKPFITTISPPPPYATLFNRNRISVGTDLLYGQPMGLGAESSTKDPTLKNRKVINGRDYLVIKEQGMSRLIPIRAPSAALFQYSYTN